MESALPDVALRCARVKELLRELMSAAHKTLLALLCDLLYDFTVRWSHASPGPLRWVL